MEPTRTRTRIQVSREKPTLGFVGLGNMGRRIALNLVQSGYKLVVYDIREAPVIELVKAGATRASSPRQLASRTQVILTSLPSTQALEQVVLGENGLLKGARQSSILIITDTLMPSTIRKISEIAKESGVSVLDAALSGRPQGAETGTLTIMVGGDEPIFTKCKPILKALGKSIFYVGETGAGEAMKLLNNLFSLVNVVTLAEGLVLATKAGVDLKTLYRIVTKSTGNSFAFEWKFPNLIGKRMFEDGFALNLACKDLDLVLCMAKDLGVPAFITSAARQIYEAARSKGLAEQDHTSVVKIYEELGKVEIKLD